MFHLFMGFFCFYLYRGQPAFWILFVWWCENNLPGFGCYVCSKIIAAKSTVTGSECRWKVTGQAESRLLVSPAPFFSDELLLQFPQPCPEIIFKLKRERKQSSFQPLRATPDNLVNYSCDFLLVFPSLWWLIHMLRIYYVCLYLSGVILFYNSSCLPSLSYARQNMIWCHFDASNRSFTFAIWHPMPLSKAWNLHYNVSTHVLSFPSTPGNDYRWLT